MWISTGVHVFIQCAWWGGDRGPQTDKHPPPSTFTGHFLKKSRHLGFGVCIDIWSMGRGLITTNINRCELTQLTHSTLKLWWCSCRDGKQIIIQWQLAFNEKQIYFKVKALFLKMLARSSLSVIILDGTNSRKQFPLRDGNNQCCGSGSVRIRNFWLDPDPIRIRNKHFRFKTNLSKGVLFLGQKKVISDNYGIFQHFQGWLITGSSLAFIAP